MSSVGDQVVPDAGFWDGAMVSLDEGEDMTSRIDEMNTPPPLLLPLLPDIGNAVDAVFNHDVNQSAVGDVDNAFASLNSLVATADSTELFVNTYDSFDVN